MDRKEPIRAGRPYDFIIRVDNGLLVNPNIVFGIEVDGDDGGSCTLKLIVIQMDEEGRRGLWKDEHEFDTNIDVDELPSFDRLVDVGSFFTERTSGLRGLGGKLVERLISLVLKERSDAFFALTDSETEAGGDSSGEEDEEKERQIIFKLQLGDDYKGEVCLPWSYASKYLNTDR